MSIQKHILYVSYDGMTDPLGQSQVLPYIIGLTKLNYRFTILSFEKKERFADGKALIESICEKHAIDWQPMMYTKKPPILSTLWDVFQMKRKIRQVQKSNPIDICHCRSHISSMGGRMLQQQKGIPFLFDMRGFYADERVDGGLWNLKNPVFKMVYTFFKKKEKEFLQNAFCSISLTHAGANIIHSWKGFENTNIKVIPCCADLNHFDGSKVDEKDLEQWRDKLDISPKQFVVSYLGSLGTWYMVDEMFAFFKQ
ncbi:MAG: glycosyltransferase, partial [Bacteroidales bacterium]|nr:glycosyltransferase [Bacteroidales bacterium]